MENGGILVSVRVADGSEIAEIAINDTDDGGFIKIDLAHQPLSILADMLEQAVKELD